MKKLILCVAVAVAVAVALSGCAWVKLTPAGEKTRVLGADEVRNCTKVGFTSASVKADVAGIHRNDDKIREELATLARNSAPELGGDTVVPIGEPENGRQVFDVYRCINR